MIKILLKYRPKVSLSLEDSNLVEQSALFSVNCLFANIGQNSLAYSFFILFQLEFPEEFVENTLDSPLVKIL